MSGFIKLLASMGIPIPRLADWLFVKDGNYYIIHTYIHKHIQYIVKAASIQIHRTAYFVSTLDILEDS